MKEANYLAKLVFVGVGITVALASILLPSGQSAEAYSYSCDTNSNHCYAISVINKAGLTGGAVSIMTTHLSSGQNGPGWFLNNEEWVADNTHCTTSSYGASWVEAGMQSVTFAAERYFWADIRPIDCNIYVHYLTNVPSGDYGYYTHFSIQQYDSSDWGISVSSHTGFWSGESTSNTMSANYIEQGMELAGQSGSSAPATTFTDRWYQQNSGNWINIGYSYGKVVYNPPNLWTTNSPQYGDFYTICCGTSSSASIVPETGRSSLQSSQPHRQPTGSHVLNVGSSGATREQVIHYATSYGIGRASVNGPITVDSAKLLTSAQIADEFHGEQTGFALNHIFWLVHVSGQFHFSSIHSNQPEAFEHGFVVIDPATGNLIMDGLLH